MKKYYSGIGSRLTPLDILDIITKLASILAEQDFILRSGGAKGADTAFANKIDEKEIFRPHHATPEAIKIASQVHPAWHKCNDYVKKLHGRNAQIILGQKLNMPSEFVVCWTPEGREVGGTRTGIKIAKKWKVQVYNLGKLDILAKCLKFLENPFQISNGQFLYEC